MATKKILVICGTGVATSTVVVQKIKEFCAAKGHDVVITQGAVADALRGGTTADFIVATTHISTPLAIPVIGGLPFLTGVGLNAVYDQIEEQLLA